MKKIIGFENVSHYDIIKNKIHLKTNFDPPTKYIITYNKNLKKIKENIIEESALYLDNISSKQKKKILKILSVGRESESDSDLEGFIVGDLMNGLLYSLSGSCVLVENNLIVDYIEDNDTSFQMGDGDTYMISFSNGDYAILNSGDVSSFVLCTNQANCIKIKSMKPIIDDDSNYIFDDDSDDKSTLKYEIQKYRYGSDAHPNTIFIDNIY